MNIPSQEQQIIINEIKNGNNVTVDACAGSGKSTTILSCAKDLPYKKIIQTTYNNQLCQEVKENIDKFALKNIKVYTDDSVSFIKIFLYIISLFIIISILGIFNKNNVI
jgi:tRNA G46 methylase TrmB